MPVFNECLLQVDYFGAIQLSTIYLLLGISCDYAFLYFDAYTQSLVEPLVAATLATRITYICQRATPVRSPGITAPSLPSIIVWDQSRWSIGHPRRTSTGSRLPVLAHATCAWAAGRCKVGGCFCKIC